VLFLTSAAAESSRAAARAGGAAGYLLKGSDPHLVLDAIRQVAGGATLWPEDPASAPNAAAATAA
jgi:DNA-binding NarL/FixJ family response regulator